MAVTNYYTVNGSIIGESTNGVRTDYLMDALGSVTGTVNSSAQVINTYRYKPFGDLLSKTGTGADPAFGWVGTQGYKQTQKKFSNFYVRARHYGSAQGRWTTVDPIGTDSGVGSLFQYVDNQVATYTDPSGLICSGFSISQKCANSDYILQGTELENSAHIPIGVPFGLVKSITKPFESNGQYVGKALGQVLVIATFCCESDEEAKKMQMYQWYSGWVKVAGKYTSNDPKDVPDSGFGTSGSKSAFPFNLRTLVRTSPKRYTMVVDDRPGLGNQSNPFQYIIAPPQKWPREYSMYFRTCIGTNLSNIQACTYWGVHAYLGIKPSRGEWQCRTRR